MRIRNYLPLFKDEGEVIAAFGAAKLVKRLNGRYELRGGSSEDLAAAHEWISLFCHEVVVGRAEGAGARRIGPVSGGPIQSVTFGEPAIGPGRP